MNFWDRSVAAVMRRRWIALALSAGITAVSVWASKGIPFVSGVTEYLPAANPDVRAWLELSKRFDAFNALMVGLEEPQAPLTSEGLSALKRITLALSEQKAAGILGARSLTNIESVREADDGSLVSDLLVPEIPKDQPGLDALSKKIAADLQVSGAMISRDQRGYALLLRADPRKDSAATAALVEKIVEKEKGPLKAFYFGAPFFTNQVTKKVYGQLWWIAPAFALLLFGILALGLRRPGVIALILVCAGTSLLWWLGVVRLFGLSLSQTSLNAALPLLVLAAVAFARGLEARLTTGDGEANPFPAPVAATLVALGLANLAMAQFTIEYLVTFGATMAAGLLAIVFFGVLAFAPAASLLKPKPVPAVEPRTHLKTNLGLAIGLAALLVVGYVSSGAKFFITPQSMFAEKDEIGQALAFFDTRFGGTDVIQIGYAGDLRDPSVAARLMRLTDLLEGSRAYGDVRSVAQVLAFLGKGFAGMHRIPVQQDSLNNLWFFLEGSTDVKNLVSDKRDEAMLVVRVPSRPQRPMAELLAIAQTAVTDSTKLGPEAAKLRLAALARVFNVDVPASRIEALVASAAAAPTEEDQKVLDEKVFGRLQAFLASPDSPYQPSAEEWTKIAAALAGSDAERKARLTEATSKIEPLTQGGMANDFVETLVSRERDMRLAARSQLLASRLTNAQTPEAFQVRSTGVVADLLDPHPKSAGEIPVLVSGMPAVAAQIENDLLVGLWKAIATLLGLAALLSFALMIGYRKVVRGLLESALATAITLATCRVLGLQVDAGSATLYLLPPMLGFLTAGWVGRSHAYTRRYPAVFLLGLAASGSTLVFTGVLPMTRIGAGMAVGLCAVVLVSYVSGLFRTDPAPGLVQAPVTPEPVRT
jgi:predicted RND superfamily exporter protein